MDPEGGVSATAYWRTPKALGHITPPGDRWPEGRGFPAWLAGLVGDAAAVIEFGCGVGRLADAFPAERYTGVDVSRHAIRRARKEAWGHRFLVVEDGDPLPRADVLFAHTVLLHVPDDALPGVVARLATAAPRVLVSEIMGRQWRRPGDPPVFNRAAEEYERAFEASGMLLAATHRRPYHRYGGVDLTVLEFTR